MKITEGNNLFMKTLLKAAQLRKFQKFQLYEFLDS